jgi:hypothetical protein
MIPFSQTGLNATLTYKESYIGPNMLYFGVMPLEKFLNTTGITLTV